MELLWSGINSIDVVWLKYSICTVGVLMFATLGMSPRRKTKVAFPKANAQGTTEALAEIGSPSTIYDRPPQHSNTRLALKRKLVWFRFCVVVTRKQLWL